MIIRLKVFEQTLSIVDTKSVPRKGSKDYLVLQFLFSSDWKDLNKVCYLQHGEVSQPIDVVDNLVEVPEWFTQQDSFDVTLFGKSGSQEVPTNVVSLRLEKSNTLWEQYAPEPQPSWLAKVIDLNNHPSIPGDNGYWMIWNTDSGVYVESELPLPAVSVGPQGPQGEKGDKGDPGYDGITPTIGANGNWYIGDTDTGKPSRGEAGGWYTPSVTQPDENTMRMAFTPSKDDMPAVADTDIKLPSGGGGLNSTAKSLLITILRDGIYNTNQSANITALSVALGNAGGDNPSIPTESISIAGDTTVNSGKTLILTATLTPSNTTDSVVWTSSNETIATVTGSGSKNTVGTVTGIKGGTVTIRAIAGSISKTYTVTVVENVSLPDGYTALDYIVSNYASGFDTGITADENTSAEYKISFIQVGAFHVLADNGAYAFPTSANGGRARSKRGGADYNYSYKLSTDTIYTIKAFAENSVNVNGTNIDTKSVVGNTPSGNGTLIFNNYGSVDEPYGSTAKYYYMKIWEGETLVRWYIPCKDVNGTVGMYDIVDNTFNASSGDTFTEV